MCRWLKWLIVPWITHPSGPRCYGYLPFLHPSTRNKDSKSLVLAQTPTPGSTPRGSSPDCVWLHVPSWFAHVETASVAKEENSRVLLNLDCCHSLSGLVLLVVFGSGLEMVHYTISWTSSNYRNTCLIFASVFCSLFKSPRLSCWWSSRH